MTKKEVIAKAKQRLKQRNADNSKIKELYFYHDRYLTLFVWFDGEQVKHKWIQLENLLLTVNETEQILDRYLANDVLKWDGIIANLKKALAENPDSMVDHVEDVQVCEKIEFTFTVRDFCELAHITVD